jgi:hypothetical protein
MAATKSAPKFEPSVESALANGDAADAYEATPVVVEPKVEAAEKAPTIRSIGLGKDAVEFEPANVRPEGEIAAQTTSAVGVWVRARYATGTPGSWLKTAATPQKVFSVVAKAKTAAEAVSALVAL